jgi:hypothetical protein
MEKKQISHISSDLSEDRSEFILRRLSIFQLLISYLDQADKVKSLANLDRRLLLRLRQ